MQGEICPADGRRRDGRRGCRDGGNLDDAAREKRGVPIQIRRGQRRQVCCRKRAADCAAEQVERVARLQRITDVVHGQRAAIGHA